MYLEYSSSRTICPIPKPHCLLLERDRNSDKRHLAHRDRFHFRYYCHDVIFIVKAAIFTVEQQGQVFTLISNLKHIETLLQALESKLYNFHHFVPGLDRRRSQLDFGGTVLKALFRTGTNSELFQMHGILDELKDRNSDLVHPIYNQVTYVKKLDTNTAINNKDIANFTTIIKHNIALSRDKFQQMTRDIMWLNFNNLRYVNSKLAHKLLLACIFAHLIHKC